MNRIARAALILVSATSVALPGWVQPTSAWEAPSAPTPGNACAPAVESQFQALKHDGEALGFHRNGSADPTLDKHYQGLQRLPGPGTPYFFISRNGNSFFPQRPDEAGTLAIVRLDSRGRDGERLRSNRLVRGARTDNTIPPDSDGAVREIVFGSGSWAYHHVGGMQTYGKVLVVPLEGRMSETLPEGKVLFFDVSNPEFPRFLYEVPVHHAAGAAALTRLPDGLFLLAVGGEDDSAEVHTYISSDHELLDPSITFAPFDIWYDDELGPGPWPTGGEAHQTLNFIEQCDGALYLVGTNNTQPPGLGGIDWADLYSVFVTPSNQVRLWYVGSKHIFCNSDGGKLCDLRAAAGMYVSPSGELILYASEHDNDGPSEDGIGTIRMGEFRHEQMFRPGSPLWAPTADAGGPYSVPEGGSHQLDAAGSRPPFAEAWAELFEHAGFAASGRSIVLDYHDRTLEDWDNINDIDDFEDEPSSVRWAAPAGCDIVLFKDRWFEGDTLTLEGDGTIREIRDLDSEGFGDETSSVRFQGTSCDGDALSFVWDTDGDGAFESAGRTASFDAAQLDGPLSRAAAVRACGAFWDCDDASTTIEVANVPPSPVVDTLLDEQGHAVGVDVDWVLEDLEVELEGSFTDPGKPDTHAASIEWGDGHATEHAQLPGFSDSTGGVIGTVTAHHVYTEPGTYTPSLTVVDDDAGVETATREIQVLGAAEVLEEVREDLETRATDPLLMPVARRHLDRAIAKLGGERARNGAIDRLRGGTLNAALVMIREALVELVAAEDVQPGLDLGAEKSLITLAAKSVVMDEMASAEGPKADEAQALVDEGDARLAAGDHVGAVEKYRRALAKLIS